MGKLPCGRSHSMLLLLEIHILHNALLCLLMFIKAGQMLLLSWLSKHGTPKPGILHNEQRHLLFGVLVSQSKKDLALKPARGTWLGGTFLSCSGRTRQPMGSSALQELPGNPSPGLSALRPAELNSLENLSVLSLSNSSRGWLRNGRSSKGFGQVNK